MKKLVFPLLTLLAFFTLTAAACNLDAPTSLKDLTDPYISRYECYHATFDGEDILKDYDYIRITILDKEDMEFSFKRTGERARAKKFGYSYDETNGELSAEESILGVKVKERVIIKNGAFTVNLPIGGKELVMRFEKM